MFGPTSWREALDRLAVLLGAEDAEEWLRETVQRAWGTDSIRSLAPADRVLAFQQTRQLVLLLEDDGLPDELVGPDGTFQHVVYRCGLIERAPALPRRERVAAAIEQVFGVRPDGPPWEVGVEPGRLSRERWADPF